MEEELKVIPQDILDDAAWVLNTLKEINPNVYKG